MESGVLLLVVLIFGIFGNAEHHMKRPVEKRQGGGGGGGVQLIIENWCDNDIWPGILTQSGDGPDENGFYLTSGDNQTIDVSGDWQGRVWGRTNCSFDDSGQSQGGGTACDTGDCGALDCEIAGASPATLAEFTMSGGHSQTFYDISLVDGYNLPMAIVLQPNGPGELANMDGSSTNPSCVGSVGDLAAQNFDPYSNGQQYLGTSSQNPLPFETKNTASTVSQWCPWDLQVDAPLAPGNGIYPYPDGDVERPIFDPCLSACAKYNEDHYCCTGAHDGPGKCQANYFSKAAKNVCPDAYSFAYDDQDSTFIIPEGGSFQVIFCPGGRSTNIIATKGSQGTSMGSSSSGSRYHVLGFGGRLVIDGRVLKTAVAGLFVAVWLLVAY